MNRWCMSALALVSVALSACHGSGVCVSSGGSVDTCKEDWSWDDCDEFNSAKVNGADWSWTQDQTCDERGFTEMCPDGTYVMPEDEDVC